MPINKAVLAALKTASRLRPDIKDYYKTQRAAEKISAKLMIPNPRCQVETLHALMPDGEYLPLKVFTPLNLNYSLISGLSKCEDSRGTIVFFHGGGWVIGNVNFYADTCTAMAIKLERQVVAVDYRKAPEYRFPQAAEDCYEVTRQIIAGHLIADVNRDNLVLCGDSAGGNLAAVVSLMARDRGQFMPRTQVLLYPLTYDDHNPSTSWFDSVRTNGYDYLLTARDIESYTKLYCSSPRDTANPYFAPLLAPNLSHQPKTIVITAEYCPLRDEGEVFAARLEHDGNQVALYRLYDAVHGYLLYPSVFNLVKDTYRIIKHELDGDELKEGEKPTWLKILGTD